MTDPSMSPIESANPDASLPGDEEQYGPPPMSRAAVTGFVCSLVFCFPLAPLVGLVLGIVGIKKTSGGKRRGRGLAIAAIPIGVVAMIVQTLFAMSGVGLWMFGKSVYTEVVPAVRDAFKASAPKVPEAAAEAYTLSSERFRIKVSEEAFQAWVADVVAQRGQLQSIRKPQTNAFEPLGRGGQQFAIHMIGRFVGGEASIDIICAMKTDFSAEFDDIRVDGESPIPE